MIKKSKKPKSLPPKNEFSDALNQVSYNDLQHFITSGKSVNIPSSLMKYIELLDMVRALYSKYETKSFIINILMLPIYSLSRVQANRIYFDMLNFFFADNEVKQKAWQGVYATHLDNIAYYAIERDELETARRCFIDAAKLRGVFNDLPQEVSADMISKPVVIYTIDPAKVGIPAASRYELTQFIDDLPNISERERTRVKHDAGIIESTLFEEIIDNDPSPKT